MGQGPRCTAAVYVLLLPGSVLLHTTQRGSRTSAATGYNALLRIRPCADPCLLSLVFYTPKCGVTQFAHNVNMESLIKDSTCKHGGPRAHVYMWAHVEASRSPLGCHGGFKTVAVAFSAEHSSSNVLTCCTLFTLPQDSAVNISCVNYAMHWRDIAFVNYTPLL